MPRLFSYGTLQQEDVQLSTFGRSLSGESDELNGFELSSVAIEDPQAGTTHYANVRYNGRNDSRVQGTLFELTDTELTAADAYEQDASYIRISAVLASGRQAWVYVHTASASQRENVVRGC
jgi:hypothetical protein